LPCRLAVGCLAVGEAFPEVGTARVLTEGHNMQITLSPVTGRHTSGGAPVLFEGTLPDGMAGVYSANGKIHFYGPKTAVTPTSVGQLDLTAIIQQAVAAAISAQQK
jgi:hypothetical protein